MKVAEILSEWNILHPHSFPTEGAWYSYLINDYLPNERPGDMGLFIGVGFDPASYLLARCIKEGKLNHKPDFKDAMQRRFKDVFGIDLTIE